MLHREKNYTIKEILDEVKGYTYYRGRNITKKNFYG